MANFRGTTLVEPDKVFTVDEGEALHQDHLSWLFSEIQVTLLKLG
jgi:hypothetical protein